MNRAGASIKKYWITFCVFSGLVPLYVYVTENKLVNPYLSPSASVIKQAFISGRDIMADNMLISFKLLMPSVIASLLTALFLGAIMGINTRAREVLYPVIYAFGVIPSILLSPFIPLMAPSLSSVSALLIVYNIMWATPFATTTGIMTIDRRYLDKAVTLELRGFKRLVKVILPAVSPSIPVEFVSLPRNSFIMLVFAEMYGAGQGIGYFMKKYTELGVFANTWIGFVFMVVILVIVTQVFRLLRRHLLKWTIDQRDSAENQRQLDKRLEKTRPA